MTLVTYKYRQYETISRTAQVSAETIYDGAPFQTNRKNNTATALKVVNTAAANRNSALVSYFRST